MNLTTHPDSLMSAPDISALVDLWHRRAALSDIEMAQIYRMVLHALRPYYPPELRGLPEDKEELVAQFIYSRVLRLELDQRASHASDQSAPSTAYALCAYFRRFLIDCLRSAAVQRNLSIEADGVQAEIDSRPHASDDPVTTVLAEYGLDEARVRARARAFIAELDQADRIILAGSLGASHERKGGLKGAAQANHVPSYHYRARKLGVTMKKAATPACFAETKIGRWVRDDLRLAITLENRQVILIVLNLLAVEAHA
ncbi:hypothetical protein [Caballeronia sp. BR00000012568055]|uniref:hypothetical protein n=1 Tax=Caballeronia sp. BR00000012568055 TaxID=2918761 RepID=UPI0023F6E1DF|nr:hypothetical protein [Caballeronia sp. BR00000012568055]